MAGASQLRCAVYTRKSSDEGLEQEYNSLHTQRDACEAYAKSQKHEGWNLVSTRYDDGGISGGTMQRPALQQLLEDIKDGRIDIVIVYKVDRLTRSLADFARMVELFDAHNVSFVSVTQQFNTTTSMGRLTLNVLLSFAQFEREVTGERIRDKIKASKQKGMWMGGYVPLGYEVKDRKLIPKGQDAKLVREIFRRYLDLGCVRLLYDDLKIKGIKSVRGKTMSRGTLYKMLSNPIYIGQIRHRNVCYAGQHEGIVDLKHWEEVQKKLVANRIGQKKHYRKSTDSLLAGKLFDADGKPLIVVHANKKGRRYRYYISKSLVAGKRENSADGWRLPAREIERIATQSMTSFTRDQMAVTSALKDAGVASHKWPHILTVLDEADGLIATQDYLKKVVLRPERIEMTLSLASLDSDMPCMTTAVPMQIKRRGVEMRLVINKGKAAKIDHLLIKTIARAHLWWGELLSGTVTSCAQIAAREKLDQGYISRVLELAFLAPDITEAILSGYQPTELTAQYLLRGIKIPMDWNEQRRLLGIS